MHRAEPQSSPDDRSPRPVVVGVLISMGLLILAPPLYQLLTDLALGARPVLADLGSAAPKSARLRQLERRLQKHSAIEGWLRPRWAALGDHLLERGNDQVSFGRGDGLFLRDSLRYLWAPAYGSPRAERALGPPAGEDPLAVILDFHRQLKERDIELLLLPVPTKATVQPDRLGRRLAAESRPQNPGFGAFVQTLTAAGVEVFDPTASLLEARRQRTGVFLVRDTHWSPEGMRRVAEELAERTRQQSLWHLLGPTAAAFDERHVTVEGEGDLAALLDSAGWLESQPMRVDVQQVIARRDGRPPIDRRSPLLLLGDSFTQVYANAELGFGIRGGLGESLAAELGLPIDVIAIPGGGANRARQALALRRAGLAGKRLVIWQISQRDLLFAREGWSRVELPPVVAFSPAEPTAERMRHKVLAFVEQMTPLPPVLDYAECLISAEYWLIDGYLPVETQRVFYVFHPGWSDFKPSRWAHLAPSTVLELELEPLAEHVDLEDSCWIDRVGVRGRPWWVISAREHR